MFTGFRIHPKGGASYYGVQPDLLTFGNAMGNGSSISAFCGRRDVMSAGATSILGQERTFLLSSTHRADMCGLASFVSVMTSYDDFDICSYMDSYAKWFMEAFNDLSALVGIHKYLFCSGQPHSLFINTLNAGFSFSFQFRTLLIQKLLANGVLLPNWLCFSLQHGHLREESYA